MTQNKMISLILCLALAACASRATQEDIQKADALGAEGKAFLAKGKNAEARDAYLSAISHDDKNARAWNGLGVAYELLGNRNEAQDAYQHAVDLSPHNPAVANNLAHLHLEQGDAASAVLLLTPYKEDRTAPVALKQNLAKATKAAQAKESLSKDIYADLGSAPTAGMAQGRVTEAKAILGKDAEALSFHVVPEVKVGGGTPVFTIRVVGKDPQSICDELNPQAIPCLPYGK